ncbi:regucalcin [Lingula anatina]|uniref:Regucalcin n=1 Tax=Lingula anatina TaxID=7574 RepID=A0A1S3KGI2_LINAN|nr:regucalcin [Lingula anatina]|eukprot:XP_013421341.1 regucalcin [Lingula anatina]
MSVSVLLENVAGFTGEGPHWDETTNRLYHVDIGGSTVHRWDAGTQQNSSVNVGGYTGFVIPSTKGDLIIGLENKIARLNWDTKEVIELAEVQHGQNTRFNDAKCDASGRLWAGTMSRESYPSQPEDIKFEKGAFYSYSVDGVIKQQLDKITCSNGMAWTKDNSVMYYIDSIPRKVYAFDFDINKGTLANRKVAIDYGDESTLSSLGYPDGMCMDTEGKLWVACYGASKVIRFDPETGKPLREIKFPDSRRITSCCFGGANFDELFVTSAKSVDPAEDVKFPLAGSVFRVTGLGVKGCPASKFDG